MGKLWGGRVPKFFATTIAATMVLSNMSVAAGMPKQILNDMVNYYVLGDIPALKQYIDVRFIGYQSLFDTMQIAVNQEAQVRIFFSNIKILNGRSVVVITTNWEKRYLLKPTMTPQLKRGQVNLMFEQFNNQWQLSAISGNNPFTH
ncbi:MAG: hypothetical protein HOP20_06590 [Sulfuriferula sp.]|nr:hypothetical protein [Sulfuriferula sp.]